MKTKTVLITGALTGIGRATALAFAQSGAKVVVSGRRAEAGAALVTDSTNVLGTLLSLKHEMRVMLAQGHGSIINLSSIAGQVGVAGASVYAASKFAVEGLTRSAALEGAAHGIRVNAVAPGPVQTDMLERFVGRDDSAKAGFLAGVPAQRAGTVDEIAETILFLASGKAPYLTGQSLAVDGGYTAQ